MNDEYKKITEIIEQFLKNAKKPLISILGPTASGKTKLSIMLAQQFNGEIISADSRQVYRKMDIATDKINIEDRMEVNHHLIDIIDPDEPFTLADYLDRAKESIEEISDRGKVPFLVGGTGLYISAVTENYIIPRAVPDEEWRKNLEKEAKENSREELHARLKKIDPESATKIHPNNLRYVIRALEINRLTGKPKKELKKKTEYDNLLIGIQWTKDALHERINQRVDEQIKRGLLQELERLLEQYEPYVLQRPHNPVRPKLPSLTSLGYRELMQFLNKEISYADAIESIKKNTRNYAKRQMTWFQKNKKIIWLDGYRLEKESHADPSVNIKQGVLKN
jgi:tRNA dimethylallyltransferase